MPSINFFQIVTSLLIRQLMQNNNLHIKQLQDRQRSTSIYAKWEQDLHDFANINRNESELKVLSSQ